MLQTLHQLNKSLAGKLSARMCGTYSNECQASDTRIVKQSNRRNDELVLCRTRRSFQYSSINLTAIIHRQARYSMMGKRARHKRTLEKVIEWIQVAFLASDECTGGQLSSPI